MESFPGHQTPTSLYPAQGDSRRSELLTPNRLPVFDPALACLVRWLLPNLEEQQILWVENLFLPPPTHTHTQYLAKKVQTDLDDS